jgi:hypothetical protein
VTNVITADTTEVIVTAVENVVNINVCENNVEVLVGDTGPQGPRGTQVLSGTGNPSPTIGLIGDQYINTTTGFIFGPKTESGWGSGVLLGSGLQINDVAYTHLQTTSSTVWTINHTLDFKPNITVVDLDGEVIEGDYQYSGNTITATFSNSITGAAYLS